MGLAPTVDQRLFTAHEKSGLVPEGRLSVAQDVSPGSGKERCLVPQGRLNPFPAVSAVPTGLAELLNVFPGLTSWAKFRPPLRG